MGRSKSFNTTRTSADRRSIPRLMRSKSGSKVVQGKAQRTSMTLEKRTTYQGRGKKSVLNEGSSVLDLKGENYFSCAVGRTCSNARYLLNSSDEVVVFLKELAAASSSSL